MARARVVGIDAGGTMTDTIVVDELANFTVGKASTTHEDESLGFIRSLSDAFGYWNIDIQEGCKDLDVVIYAGTTMINTILERRGRRCALITTKGFEDDILMGRGLQCWAGYSYEDRIHAVTHKHPKPMVRRSDVFGVTERIDCFGQEAIPLYLNEVEEAARIALGRGITDFIVHFIFSYLDNSHEKEAKKVILDKAKLVNLDVNVFCGSEVRPIIRENARLNCTTIEAYAAAPVREHLFKIEAKLANYGYKNPLQTVLSYGGLCDIRYPRLHETFISGPVGGMTGALYIGKILNEKNIITTDLGGTSFDIGVITDGYVPVEQEPTLAQFKLNLPTISLESIGAGAGSLIKVDPLTKKIAIGPESAGSTPGPMCFDRGGKELTICDCDAILGYLNPDNFLGGEVKLNIELAMRGVREQLSDILNIDPYQAAEGVLRIFENRAKDAIRTVASARGLDTSDYVLMCYGGAGPQHLVGYTREIKLKGILTFPYAAAFSAFGCTVGDYMHRYSKSVGIIIPPGGGDQALKMAIGQQINATWLELENQAIEEMANEGIEKDRLKLTHLVMMRYAYQLTDLEAISPVSRIKSPGDIDAVIKSWEELYEKINRRVSRYEGVGYQIFELGLLASADKLKPVIKEEKLSEPNPPGSAIKGVRRAYYDREWHDAKVFAVDSMLPGNVVIGPALVEHPMTVLFVPPRYVAKMDKYKFIWINEV